MTRSCGNSHCNYWRDCVTSPWVFSYLSQCKEIAPSAATGSAWERRAVPFRGPTDVRTARCDAPGRARVVSHLAREWRRHALLPRDTQLPLLYASWDWSGNWILHWLRCIVGRELLFCSLCFFSRLASSTSCWQSVVDISRRNKKQFESFILGALIFSSHIQLFTIRIFEVVYQTWCACQRRWVQLHVWQTYVGVVLHGWILVSYCRQFRISVPSHDSCIGRFVGLRTALNLTELWHRCECSPRKN